MISVRPYEQSDFKGVVDVLEPCLLEQEQYAPKADYARTTMEGHTESLEKEGEGWWVALENERVVGVMKVHAHYRSQSSVGPCSLLAEIDVVRYARGRDKGVADKLLMTAEGVARRAGAKALLSSTHRLNRRSLDFHCRNHFREPPEDLRLPDRSSLVILVKDL